MIQYRSDTELFALMKAELFTAVLGDVMDKTGLLHQFLPPYLRPIREDMILAAYEKAHGEKLVYKALTQGMGAVEAFDKFGIM